VDLPPGGRGGGFLMSSSRFTDGASHRFASMESFSLLTSVDAHNGCLRSAPKTRVEAPPGAKRETRSAEMAPIRPGTFISRAKPCSADDSPSTMVDAPPGAHRTPVLGRSASALPLLGLEPRAKAFAEMVQPSASDVSAVSAPRQSVEAPPGAHRTPVLGRSASTLPPFGLEPWAKAFADILPLSVLGAAVTSTPRQSVESPPGAHRTGALGRSPSTLPLFGLEP